MNCFIKKCEICAHRGEIGKGRLEHCHICICGDEYEPMSIESLYPQIMIDPKKLAEMSYIKYDTVSTRDIIETLVDKRFGARKVPNIKNVIFNDPATIVFWSDGTKTVVKTQNGDEFDPEKGLAMAISKKALGNNGRYFNDIKKWTDKYYTNYEDVIVEDRKPLTYSDIYKDFLERYPSLQERAENHWTAALSLHNSIYVHIGGKRYVYSYDSKFLSPVAD